MMKNALNPIVKGLKPIEGATPSGSRALVCPKCNSYYVNDKQCDGCGLIFNKPRTLFFQDRDNIFNLRSDYYEQLPFWSKKFSFFEDRKSMVCNEYKRRLLKRLRVICGALSEDGQRLLFQKDQDGSFLKYELSEILKELFIFQVDLDRVEKVVSSWHYQDVVGMWIKNQVGNIFETSFNTNFKSKKEEKIYVQWVLKTFFENFRQSFKHSNSPISNSERKILIFVSGLVPLMLVAYFLLYFVVSNKQN